MNSKPTHEPAISTKRTQSRPISSGRWAAYAAAGVASTVALTPSAEADVHYSGVVNYDFAAHDGFGAFPLDPGVSLAFRVGVATGSSDNFGHVAVNGATGAFAGHLTAYTSPLASALPERVRLSQQGFAVSCRHTSSFSTIVCYYSGDNLGADFRNKGVAFLGFEFTNESGRHYGWARVKASGAPDYRFKLVDYAWADAHEELLTGQKKSHRTAQAATKAGSLGLLAVGAAGLRAWRAEK